MHYAPISLDAVSTSYQRLQTYLKPTPILTSQLLNKWLGHHLYFKIESMQKTGAFKARGALNALLTLKEQHRLPEHVITVSSGNHGQALAWAANQLGIKATIYTPKHTSLIKRQAAQSYGADIIVTHSRADAEAQVKMQVEQGAILIHPFDNDDVILGQSTCCYEALNTVELVDAIFVPCGGGGLASGSFLAKSILSPKSQLVAGEPKLANDVVQSIHAKRIISLPSDPIDTIADGARTLKTAARNFYYLRQLDRIYEIEESELIYWTGWLMHLLKIVIEPTSALAMAAAIKWLQTTNGKQRLLIILSGGNITSEMLSYIGSHNPLGNRPTTNKED